MDARRKLAVPDLALSPSDREAAPVVDGELPSARGCPRTGRPHPPGATAVGGGRRRVSQAPVASRRQRQLEVVPRRVAGPTGPRHRHVGRGLGGAIMVASVRRGWPLTPTTVASPSCRSSRARAATRVTMTSASTTSERATRRASAAPGRGPGDMGVDREDPSSAAPLASLRTSTGPLEPRRHG